MTLRDGQATGLGPAAVAVGDDGDVPRAVVVLTGVAQELLDQMRWAEEKTAANERITLYVAFNYGGRAEIIDAARSFDGTTEEEFRAHLYAPEMHDPDLIIRTSGEQRLSNYLLWQSAYSELHFTDVLWPDFGRADLEFALAEFDARRRRFGGR